MSQQLDQETTNQSLDFGQKAVGLTFNPSNGTEIGDHVQTIKEECAAVINTLNNLRNSSMGSEQKRMYSVAITELQTAQMWGVKAATWQP
jgi:hypothetical protein